MWLWFQIRTKLLEDRRIWPKKARICILLSTPLYTGLNLYKRGYYLSPLGLATVNPVVLTGVQTGVLKNMFMFSLTTNDVQA